MNRHQVRGGFHHARSDARRTACRVRSPTRDRITGPFCCRSRRGLIGTRGALGGLERLPPVNLPRAEYLAIDWPVLTFTAVLAMLTTVLSGLGPALNASRTRLLIVMQDGRRSSKHNRLRSAFVISEAALGVILLVGAACC
jgi:hypothetical protein